MDTAAKSEKTVAVADGKLRFKAGEADEAGWLEGLLAVYGNVDQDNETFVRAASPRRSSAACRPAACR